MAKSESVLSADHLQLYNLLIEANKNQTDEIKDEIQQSIQGIKNELRETQTDVKELKAKLINIERKSRKNNIIVFGLEDHKEERLIPWVLEKLNNILGLNYTEDHINNIYRIGKNKKGPVIIEFISYMKKAELFQNTERLRKLKENNLSIANDLCSEDREVQRILRQHLKIARAQNLPSKIKGDKLIINNIPHTVQQLQQAVQEDNGESDSSSYEENDQDLPQQNKGKSSTVVLQSHSNTEQRKPVVETSCSEKRTKKKVFYQHQKHPINTRSKNS